MNLADPENIAARALRSAWLLPAAGCALLCLLILVSVPWRYNRLDLHAVSGMVEVTASTRATHQIGVKLPEGAELRLYGTNLQSRPPELAQLSPTSNGIRLIAGSIVLDNIVVEPNTILTILTTADGSPDLRITGGGAIRITLSGTIQQIADNGVSRQLAIAERPFGLDASPSGTAASVRLVVPGAGKVKGLAIYDQPINALSFARPRPGNEDERLPFQSELVSGKLKLLDTRDEVTLQPRELIWLKEAALTVGRLELAADGVAIDVSGHALSIGIGPPRPGSPPLPDRELTPSVLAYLLGQHEVKLAWGAAIAVLAALWKARQWALKWGK